MAATVWLILVQPESVRSIAWLFVQMALFFAISLPFVLVAGATFGLPARILLARNTELTFPLFVVTGSCIGAVAGIIVLGIFLTSMAASVPAATFGLIGGFTASLSWWLLVERHLLAGADA